jgi:transposase
MVSRGPRALDIALDAGEREQLESWARRRRTAAGLATRSRIVLAAADGESNSAIARRLGAGRPTVAKWRARFASERLAGLLDEPRPGRPRTVGDKRVEELIVRTLETVPPDGGTHWSTRQMAAASGLSQSTVSRVWRAFGLQPHRVEHWRLSKDPLFVEKVRDIVGLYLDPPERALVLCVDEKSQIQALDRSQPILPVLPGCPARATHDYSRHGTSSLFAALDAASGKVIGSLHARHRAIEFKRFLATLDREVPGELEVHLILDNYATHKTPAVKRWLASHPRFALHFTPTGASWLNLVERWFAELTARKLRRGVHRSRRDLNRDIRDWLEHWNEDPRPFIWTKSSDEILETIAAYCTRITDSGQ